MPAPRRLILPPRFAGLLIAVGVFVAVAPTLSWLEFGDPIENLNVATAMEIRRTGRWLIPTLQGEPRLAKPPLTAWLTALSIRRSTLDQLDALDPATRATACRWLAFECRLPALLAMCAMLAMAYEMGRAMGIGAAEGPTDVGVAVERDGEVARPGGCPHAGAERSAAERRPGSGGAAMTAPPDPGRRSSRCAPAALPRRESLRNGIERQISGHRLGWTSALVCGTTFLFLRQCRVAATDAQLALWVAAANLFLARAIFRRRWYAGCLGAGAALGLAMMSKGPIALVQSVLPFAAFLLWRRVTSRASPSAVVAAGTPPPPARRRLIPVALGTIVMLVVGLTWYAWAASQFAGAKSLWLAEASRFGAEGPPSGKPWYEYAIGLYHFLPWLPWLAAGAWLAIRDRTEPRRTRSAAPGPVAAALLLLLPLLVMSFSRDRFTRYLTPLAPAGALLAGGAIARYPRRNLTAVATVAIAAAMLAGQVVYFHWLSGRPSSRSTLRPVAEQIRAAYPDAELYAYRPGGVNVISVPADDLSIHLNRTVGWARDPQRIAPSSRPQVFVIYRTKRPGEPDLAPPPGWRLLAKPRAAGNEDRYVFVRPAQSNGNSSRWSAPVSGKRSWQEPCSSTDAKAWTS